MSGLASLALIVNMFAFLAIVAIVLGTFAWLKAMNDDPMQDEYDNLEEEAEEDCPSTLPSSQVTTEPEGEEAEAPSKRP